MASDSTPLLAGPLTNDEISWIGSVNCIGGILGSVSIGYFTTRMGSKRVLLFLAFPSIAFWLLIYLGDTYYHILIARFICGFTGNGMMSTTILFVSEIANDEYAIFHSPSFSQPKATFSIFATPLNGIFIANVGASVA